MKYIDKKSCIWFGSWRDPSVASKLNFLATPGEKFDWATLDTNSLIDSNAVLVTFIRFILRSAHEKEMAF